MKDSSKDYRKRVQNGDGAKPIIKEVVELKKLKK